MAASSPAFPFIVPGGGTQQTGLSKREFFALAAMQGLLAGKAAGSAEPSLPNLAAKAFQIADAMLDQAEKKS